MTNYPVLPGTKDFLGTGPSVCKLRQTGQTGVFILTKQVGLSEGDAPACRSCHQPPGKGKAGPMGPDLVFFNIFFFMRI